MKFNKYSLKFCKLYDEDVFGRFAIRPKKTHKVLNVLYYELLKQTKRLKLLYQNYIKYCSLLRVYLYDLIEIFKYNVNVLRLRRRRRVILKNKKLLKKKLTNLHIRKLVYIIKKRLYLVRFTLNLFRLNNEKFNYRVDIGKPKRIKRKVTRYTLRLLTRHKITSFAAKMPVYQFRNYILKGRNFKYFGMYFLMCLESRVDFMLYRLNFSNSPGYIRQYIKHNGVLVNNKLITTPSYSLSINDTLSFVDKKDAFNKIFYNFFKKIVFMGLPVYYEVNFRLLLIRFFLIPKENYVFYPFNFDKLKLSSFGKQF